ncbi:hypothetical protein [Serratia fonticola]|uniref:Uncharacterized protein n=1 Tax=Serratia fonticola TaxID=47917 RepID=A0AAE7JVN7_SERFO|nr:hypothetical protein [Serratia fonticola]QKJ61135.1 hypothetical protein G9399_26220 [Serratia fonticola]
MLKDPDIDLPYSPDMYYFLYGFDVYEKDEGFVKDLESHDPNNVIDRRKLIINYFIGKFNYLSYRHKYVLVKILNDAINNEKYNFSKIINSYEDDYSCLPWSWDIKDPRAFFEDILRIAKEYWKDELQKASLEDQCNW